VLNRRSASYKELGLDEKKVSKKEAVDLMLKDVNLIRRPLVIRGKTRAFGFDTAELERFV
jgi:arsenate reductase-like glutaredoxin family protein